MLGKNFEFEDINFRNVFNVHYLYLYIVTFKINYSTQLYSIQEVFLFKYLHKYFEKD